MASPQITPLSVANNLKAEIQKLAMRVVQPIETRYANHDTKLSQYLAESGRCSNISISSDGQGGFMFKDDNQAIEYLIAVADVARKHRCMNCLSAVALVVSYLVKNKINIPVTILAFKNYDHQVAALNFDEQNFQIGQVIIIDLWNSQNPVQTLDQYQQTMKPFLKAHHLQLNKEDDSLVFARTLHIPNPAAVKISTPYSNLMTALGLFAGAAAVSLAIKHIAPIIKDGVKNIPRLC